MLHQAVGVWKRLEGGEHIDAAGDCLGKHLSAELRPVKGLAVRVDILKVRVATKQHIWEVIWNTFDSMSFKKHGTTWKLVQPSLPGKACMPSTVALIHAYLAIQRICPDPELPGLKSSWSHCRGVGVGRSLQSRFCKLPSSVHSVIPPVLWNNTNPRFQPLGTITLAKGTCEVAWDKARTGIWSLTRLHSVWFDHKRTIYPLML